MGTTTALLTVDEFLKLPAIEGSKTEWSAPRPMGKVYNETAYRLDEHNVLIPDVSVLLKERILPAAKGLIQGAPGLAIEVVSSETASDLQGKIRTYLKHGTGLEEAQVLEDQDVLPGFSTPIRAIFEGL